MPNGDGLLEAITGLVGGAAPGVARGLAQREALAGQAAQQEQAGLLTALDFLQRERAEESRLEAALAKERGRLATERRKQLGTRFRDFFQRTLTNPLSREIITKRKELSDIEKDIRSIETPEARKAELRMQLEGGVDPTTQLPIIGKRPELQNLMSAETEAGILEGNLRGLDDPEDMRAFLSAAQSLVRETDIDTVEKFQRTVDVLGRSLSPRVRPLFGSLATNLVRSGRLRIKPAEAEPDIPPVPPKASELLSEDELMDLISQNIDPGFSLFSRTLRRASPVKGVQRRDFVTPLGDTAKSIALKEARRIANRLFLATGRGVGRQATSIRSQERNRFINRLADVLERQSRQISGEEFQIPGAQAGLLPPREPLNVDVSPGEAILPAPTVEALGGTEGIQALAPGALAPPVPVEQVAVPSGLAAPFPQALPPQAPPLLEPKRTEQQLDLTEISRPQVRQVAQNLAGPGASEDDLDTLTDLLDGLIESEDLAELT